MVDQERSREEGRKREKKWRVVEKKERTDDDRKGKERRVLNIEWWESNRGGADVSRE